MKLYYTKGACSLTVRILVHELAIPCEFEAVDLKTKLTAAHQDFLTINPKGAIPALRLDNQDLLTENAVILQYLADQYHATHFLPALGDGQRYRVLEWLNFVSTDLHKNCSPLFNTQVPTELKTGIFMPILENKLRMVATQLGKHTYLVSDDFTLADIYLWVVLRWLPHLGLTWSAFPTLEPYFLRVSQRDAVQQSLKEEGLLV